MNFNHNYIFRNMNVYTVKFWNGTKYYYGNIPNTVYAYIYYHAKKYNTVINNCCFVDYGDYIQVHIISGPYANIPLPTIVKASYNF